MSKPIVFLVCSGLGRINRGYETFTQECYEALKENEEFELYLLRGAGKSIQREVVIKNIYRKSIVSRLIGKIINKEPYFIEQLSFCIAMVPLLLRKKPTLIYYSDFFLGTFLWKMRKWLNLNYKLLFSNGAPNGPPFSRCDAVHQLSQLQKTLAIKVGESDEKHFVVPYGFNIDKHSPLLTKEQKVAERRSLGIPDEMFVVLSVGAINNSHKRMEYLIREIYSLNRDDLFLQLLGTTDKESENIIRLGGHLLGPNRFSVKTVPQEQVQQYYKIADVFVLASLHEGFGRVYIEALSCGVKVVAHRSEITEEIMGNTSAILIDMQSPGFLLPVLTPLLQDSMTHEVTSQRDQEYVYDHYSWNVLKPRYVEMINKYAR